MNNFHENLSRNRTFIMGCAMVSIMLFHQVWLKGLPFLAFRLVGHFGVDVFFFISGYGICHSLMKNSTKEYFKRRLTRILPPCLLIGLIKYLLSKFGTKELRDIDVSWLTILGFDMWFIVGIIIMYILSPLFFRLLKNYYLYLAVFAISAICVLTTEYSEVFSNTIIRAPAYILGMLLAKHKTNLPDSYLNYGVIIVFAAIVYKVLLAFAIIDGVELLTFIFLSIGIPSLCWWLGKLGNVLSKYNCHKPILFFGTYSIELYLWHEFIYDWVWGINTDRYTSFALIFIFSVILAYISNKILSILTTSIVK